jgi:hypothetical protein
VIVRAEVFFTSALREIRKKITRLNPDCQAEEEDRLVSATTETDLVRLVADRIISGIDEAVAYWLGRIEQELVNSDLSQDEQLRAIELILQEYKQVTGKLRLSGAEA